MLIEEGSLLIFYGDAYEKYLHCIDESLIETVSFVIQINFEKGMTVFISSSVDNFELTCLWIDLKEKLLGLKEFEEVEKIIRKNLESRFSSMDGFKFECENFGGSLKVAVVFDFKREERIS